MSRDGAGKILFGPKILLFSEKKKSVDRGVFVKDWAVIPKDTWKGVVGSGKMKNRN